MRSQSRFTSVRPRRCCGESRRGFTLIETIAAIVILAVALPPLLWAVRESHVQRIAPVQVSTARWLAAEKIEDIIADRHSTTRGYDFVVGVSYPDEPSVAGFSVFGRSVSVVEKGPDLTTAGQGYKLVTVQVEWVDARGAARTLTLATVVTEYD